MDHILIPKTVVTQTEISQQHDCARFCWQCFFVLSFFVVVFCPSRATPAAYGGSQARGLIRAFAAGLGQSHSNARSKPHLGPIPQFTATLDP